MSAAEARERERAAVREALQEERDYLAAMRDASHRPSAADRARVEWLEERARALGGRS